MIDLMNFIRSLTAVAGVANSCLYAHAYMQSSSFLHSIIDSNNYYNDRFCNKVLSSQRRCDSNQRSGYESIVTTTSSSLSSIIIQERRGNKGTCRMSCHTSLLSTNKPIDENDGDGDLLSGEESSDTKNTNDIWKKFFRRNKDKKIETGDDKDTEALMDRIENNEVNATITNATSLECDEDEILKLQNALDLIKDPLSDDDTSDKNDIGFCEPETVINDTPNCDTDDTDDLSVKSGRRRFWVIGKRSEIKTKKSFSTTTSSATDDKIDDIGNVNDGIEKSPRKKNEKVFGKTFRTFGLIAAIVIYPLVADEVSDRITVQTSSSSAPRMRSSDAFKPEHNDDSTSSIPTVDDKDIDKLTTSLKIEINDSKENKKKGGKMKDKIPPIKERRSLAIPPARGSGRDGKNDNSNKKNNAPVSIDDKRRLALSFISDVVDEVGPSVVRIDTESNPSKSPSTRSDGYQPSPYVQQGQGSGLIFSSEGFILTNAHVVEDANKVKVTLTDGRVYFCDVTGTDDIVDIAVLKITSNSDDSPSISNLPVAELGDSDKLKVGKVVVAVGSPGGLDNTVTMGIVSGRERSSMMVGVPHKLVNYIQTDAAINPGNSGGPLIDVETGQVIGINAAIRAHMEGTSFAIPINRVRDIMHDLSEGKEIKHGYLGCQLTSCTPQWARENNADTSGDRIEEVYGAFVHKIYKKSSAHLGGLKEHDIIQQIGTETVRSASDASRWIDLATPDENIPFTVLRNGNVKIINVKPKDMSSTQKEIQREQQRRQQEEKNQFQELGPFRSFFRD